MKKIFTQLHIAWLQYRIKQRNARIREIQSYNINAMMQLFVLELRDRNNVDSSHLAVLYGRLQ